MVIPAGRLRLPSLKKTLTRMMRSPRRSHRSQTIQVMIQKSTLLRLLGRKSPLAQNQLGRISPLTARAQTKGLGRISPRPAQYQTMGWKYLSNSPQSSTSESNGSTPASGASSGRADKDVAFLGFIEGLFLYMPFNSWSSPISKYVIPKRKKSTKRIWYIWSAAISPIHMLHISIFSWEAMWVTNPRLNP